MHGANVPCIGKTPVDPFFHAGLRDPCAWDQRSVQADIAKQADLANSHGDGNLEAAEVLVDELNGHCTLADS
jgi:hypothetical protein